MTEEKASGAWTHLHQGKLLLAGVVVSGGSLVLLGVVGTLLVGVLVGRVNQLPGILPGKTENGEGGSERLPLEGI